MKSDKSNSNLYGSGYENDDSQKPLSVVEAKRIANGNVCILGTIVSVSESYFLEVPDPVDPTKRALRRARSIQLEDTERLGAIERLDVILFEEMTKNVRAGEVVKIRGSMKVQAKKDNGKNKKKFNVVDAVYLEYLNRKDVIVTQRDIESFHRFARNPYCILCRLVAMFAPDIIGQGPAKLGLLRSIVGGLVLPTGNADTSTSKGSELNKKYDGRVHTLFVGDPGTAKSSLLDEAIKVKPNSRKVSAPHASTKTISAIIEKEGEQYTLRIGAIPLSAGAICGVNEIAHFPPEDQGRLLDVMEEGRFPLDKHGQHYDIPCPTTIVGTANPIQGRWSDSEIAHTDEINLRNTLIERFTQIYTFRDKEEKGFVNKMNMIRKRRPSNYNFLIKYLVYASSIKDINITDEAEYMLNTFWDQAKSTGSLNVRMYLGIYRLAEAQAKLQLKNIIDEEVAAQVIEAVQFMMTQFNRTGGTVRSPREMAYCCFLEILQRVKIGITIPEICRIACEENTQVEEYLGRRWSVDQNMKLRRVVDLLLENSKIKRVNVKPTVLLWESDTYDTYDTDANAKSNQYSNM